MQSIKVNTVVVQPLVYSRTSLSAFGAVTINTADSRGLVTINHPEAAYVRSDGTLTIKGLRGTGTTLSTKRGFVEAFYDRDGVQVTMDDGSLPVTVQELLDLLIGEPWS